MDILVSGHFWIPKYPLFFLKVKNTKISTFSWKIPKYPLFSSTSFFRLKKVDKTVYKKKWIFWCLPSFPSYILHESCCWSGIHQSWFFLSRRMSKETYEAETSNNCAPALIISFTLVRRCWYKIALHPDCLVHPNPRSQWEIWTWVWQQVRG